MTGPEFEWPVPSLTLPRGQTAPSAVLCRCSGEGSRGSTSEHTYPTPPLSFEWGGADGRLAVERRGRASRGYPGGTLVCPVPTHLFSANLDLGGPDLDLDKNGLFIISTVNPLLTRGWDRVRKL